LGAEDNGLTKNAIEKSHHLVKFDTRLSVNISVAGSIIMYDRNMKKKFAAI
jgi:tRNA (guanosine-2'-O-)-methyltransferase